ncbi:MAG: sigma-70 family RNA polymerase sigma factor [Clostridia bacterium]|nr:sigma-70 family RNA polymerase sigma factor [Clostridia bacterium]
MENIRKEYYITINHEKITVTKEVRTAWDQAKDRVFYQARKEGTCGNSSFATCCGDCGLCRWSKEGIRISLDNEKYHFHCSENGPKRDFSPTEKVADPADIVSEEDAARRLLDFARKVCPSGDAILSMHAEGCSTYEIAEETGIPQKTVHRRLLKLKQHMARYIRNSKQ